MKYIVTRIVLFGSGTLLVLIGGALMVSPIAFLETSHVFVERDPGLMSELTAPVGILIITGTLMVFGAFRCRLASLALIVGAVVYGAYGIGRIISTFLHGVPPDSLIIATVIEVAIAALLSGLGITNRLAQNTSEADTQLLHANL